MKSWRILSVITLCLQLVPGQVNFGSEKKSLSSSAADTVESTSSSGSASEDVNTRFFGLFKPKPKPVWRPQAQTYSSNSCGRRRRGAEEGSASPSTRFFLKPKSKPSAWVGCSCGRRKRQAEEPSTNTRFFGLFKPKPKPKPRPQRPHCGSCCYSSNQQHHKPAAVQSNSHYKPQQTAHKPQPQPTTYSSGSSGGCIQRSGSLCSAPSPSSSGCQCSTQSLVFKDQYGTTHGDCQSSDDTGKKWCYTTGPNAGCGDLVKSQRYSNNPWSYEACSTGTISGNGFIRGGRGN